MQSPRLLGTSQTAPARATDRRVSNPKLESIRVSGDTNRRQAPLISGQAEALPYASPATSTYGGAEVIRARGAIR